ncbi:MAG: hypothetical protein KGM17_03645 [Sphingomonadales bacterium]|nr:hypothetical protein [Sphingomonadales bacterium]
MGRYLMIVQSQAHPGREAEYAAWYDGTHVQEICSVPGVVSGQRYEATPVALGAPGMACLSIYELDVESPQAFLAELGKFGASGRMTPCDAYNSADSIMWFYKQPD